MADWLMPSALVDTWSDSMVQDDVALLSPQAG